MLPTGSLLVAVYLTLTLQAKGIDHSDLKHTVYILVESNECELYPMDSSSQCLSESVSASLPPFHFVCSLFLSITVSLTLLFFMQIRIKKN